MSSLKKNRKQSGWATVQVGSIHKFVEERTQTDFDGSSFNGNLPSQLAQSEFLTMHAHLHLDRCWIFSGVGTKFTVELACLSCSCQHVYAASKWQTKRSVTSVGCGSSPAALLSWYQDSEFSH